LLFFKPHPVFLFDPGKSSTAVRQNNLCPRLLRHRYGRFQCAVTTADHQYGLPRKLSWIGQPVHDFGRFFTRNFELSGCSPTSHRQQNGARCVIRFAGLDNEAVAHFFNCLHALPEIDFQPGLINHILPECQ